MATMGHCQAYSLTLTNYISIAQGMLSWLLCSVMFCFSGLIICGSLTLKLLSFLAICNLHMHV